MEPLRKAEILSVMYKHGWYVKRAEEDSTDLTTPLIGAGIGGSLGIGSAVASLPRAPLEGERQLLSMKAPADSNRYAEELYRRLKESKLKRLAKEFPRGSVKRMREIVRTMGTANLLKTLGLVGLSGAAVGGGLGYGASKGYGKLKENILEENRLKQKGKGAR